VQQSLQNSVCLGQHQGGLPSLNLLGAWQKSDAPALQAGSSGRDTRRPPPFHCGENEIQASLISSASVGATPTPATNLREVIRLPACKTGVSQQAGSDDWGVTSTSHHFWTRSSISRAPRCLREGCLRTATRVQLPSGPPFYGM
jgi:hypothetical protein